MAKKREPRILFFTANAMPTEREQQLADLLGGNVGFRVGRLAHRDKAEACDAVAAAKGDLIPNIYAVNNIPRVKVYADVLKLKPRFVRDIGYSDDEDDYGAIDLTGAGPTDVPEQPDDAGEPKPEKIGEDGGTAPLVAEDAKDDETPPASRRGRKTAADAPGGAPTPPAAAPAASGTPPAATTPWSLPPIPPANSGGGQST